MQDNLELACSAIERAAMERATNDIDEGFASSIEARRRHREVSVVYNIRHDELLIFASGS